ncbi:helix-turn-helix domain-containing protein [Herbidospora sp. NBRC 101105]|uniref:helix-turn-helix domain-containing protein n=1 Tax=Herbidospora sp. NBRC 101105 TaxID=3032195 RepID=UPI0024A1FB53|nr:helix-turn-helix domain-containing protein [Herbidospora sp. NBRC 101105]GLX98057.1 transcriptional regulator [Herbidospora sp. NBRC 101105]
MNSHRMVTDDVGLLRAMAHPARLAILGRLQEEGPATATECAEVAGLSPSACSYHLRTLAKHGLIEEAPARGDGRERVWRALQKGWGMKDPESGELTAELLAAQSAVIQTVLDEASRRLSEYLAQSSRESADWRQATRLAHMVLYMDPDEIRALAGRVDELVAPYRITDRDPGTAPNGARVTEFQLRIFPRAPKRS